MSTYELVMLIIAFATLIVQIISTKK
ncbi:MAG: putative holin-like toxin [Acutalibacteraceae bacterium]